MNNAISEELSFHLDDDCTYKITKIGVKNPDSRYVNVGDSSRGEAKVFLGGVLCGELLTSEVVNFEFNDINDNLVIETKNSVYTLEKLDESV